MNSLSTKLSWLVVITILVVSTVVSTGTYLWSRQNINNDFNVEKTLLQGQMEVIFAEPVFVYDLAGIDSIAQSFLKSDTISKVNVVDQRGKLMVEAQTENGKIDEALSVDILWNDELVGTVEVGLSHAQMGAALSGLIIQAGVTTIIITLLSAVALAIGVKRTITNPLNRLNSILSDIAQGGGDLTAQIPIEGNDELSKLGRDFNAFIDTVRQIVIEMAEAASELSQVTSTIESSCHNSDQQTNFQKDLTEQLLDKLNQLTTATHEIASNAETTAEKTKEVNTLSTQSQTDISSNIQLIGELVGSLQNTATVVSELKEASDNIGSVLDVIKTIAEQTNLLALNAAIEAARAGDQGRGFAVVADEVRALASKTHQSTTEIESIIEKLQEQSDASYNAMQRSTELVNQTRTSADASGTALSKISSDMDHVLDMNNMIASASEEQSSVTQEVKSDVDSLNEGAGSLKQDTDKLLAASVELVSVGSKLQSQISKFRY